MPLSEFMATKRAVVGYPKAWLLERRYARPADGALLRELSERCPHIVHLTTSPPKVPTRSSSQSRS